MGTPATTSGGTGGEIRCTQLYSVEKYIRLHTPKIDARRFAIMPTEEVLELRSGREDLETAFTG